MLFVFVISLLLLFTYLVMHKLHIYIYTHILTY